jgi:riboflavin kinase / FMN adenylyltransferase
MFLKRTNGSRVKYFSPDMQLLRNLKDLYLKASWVTIGSFDGVHRGHQEIIRKMVDEAHSSGIPVVVVTFYPHPIKVLRGNQGPLYLSTVDERADLLGQLGVDYVITLEFTHQLAELSAFSFMKFLQDHLNFQQLWIGYDFALGKNREGNFDRLSEIGLELGYKVEMITSVSIEGEIVSSSRIRGLIKNGKVEQAARLLGRYYSITRPVIHGDGRGRDLGFPTANLEPCEECILPGNGIYATFTYFEGNRYLSATNVGFRPTFDLQSPIVPQVEVYILDFDQNIYARQIKLEFVRFLRPEQRFSSIEKLKEQMIKDASVSREVLIHDQQSTGLST